MLMVLFLVKPSMPETTALGAAMAAGAAEGVSVWSLNPEDLSEVTSEKFEPQINPEGMTQVSLHTHRASSQTSRSPESLFPRMCLAESEFRYARWKKAVQRSMNWETTEPACNGNGRQDHAKPPQKRLNIIPVRQKPAYSLRPKY